MLLNNRRRLIVNREVQFDLLSFLSVSCAIFFASQTILALLFYMQIQDIIPHLTSKELIRRYGIPFFVLQIVPLSAYLIISTIYFNRLTNRVVGPIYNIRKTFENALVTNNFRPIILREGDYFKREIDIINEYMNKKTG